MAYIHTSQYTYYPICKNVSDFCYWQVYIQMMNIEDNCKIDSQQLAKHRRELIPNFNNLDMQVRLEVYEMLKKIMMAEGNKNKLHQLSRMCQLEQAPLLRSHLWKLMLQTIDGPPHSWEQIRNNNSELYKALRNKFLPSYVDEEDLLDLGDSSTLDRQLWDQIALDTKRTHSALNFFQMEVSFGKVFASKATKHCDMLGRILYIWGKTNPTVRYVQGMNQILAPLYYLQFQSIDSISWDRESQVFFMFSAIMSSVIDMHIKEMDDCQSGIMGRMLTLNQFLRIVDGQLWQKMQTQGIYPQYYSFRWMALLLAQEFTLNDTMKLWDFVLSFEGHKRFFFVNCACIGILKIRKKEIMENDFITSLPLIQKLRDVDIDNVIRLAIKYYNDYKRKNIPKMYEELIALSEKQQQLDQAQRSSCQGKAWSYAEMVKSTGNYLSKLAYWKKKG